MNGTFKTRKLSTDLSFLHYDLIVCRQGLAGHGGHANPAVLGPSGGWTERRFILSTQPTLASRTSRGNRRNAARGDVGGREELQHPGGLRLSCFEATVGTIPREWQWRRRWRSNGHPWCFLRKEIRSAAP